MEAIGAPCKTCSRRGCGSYHDKCKKYADFKSMTEARKKHDEKEYIVYAYIHERNVKK